MSSWRHFKINAAQLPAPETLKLLVRRWLSWRDPQPSRESSGVGRDAEREQGRVVAGPECGQFGGQLPDL